MAHKTITWEGGREGGRGGGREAGIEREGEREREGETERETKSDKTSSAKTMAHETSSHLRQNHRCIVHSTQNPLLSPEHSTPVEGQSRRLWPGAGEELHLIGGEGDIARS